MNTSFAIKAFDKNGKEIYQNESVNVPEPNGTDIHQHEFTGIAIDHLPNGNIVVEDGDSDFFEIEANRLEVVGENYHY